MASSAFEGDLIRSLGLVTLHFAYAEYELDRLLDALSPLQPYQDKERASNVGLKLSRARRLLRGLNCNDLAGPLQTLGVRPAQAVSFVPEEYQS